MSFPSATGTAQEEYSMEILSVNGVEIKVNKYHLAYNSSYFERSFFDKEYTEDNIIVLELPATVEHFKRMLDTLNPKNSPLDDDCIENVLNLSSKFSLPEVKEKCCNFLSNWSNRSSIFKYRMAEKYGFAQLKQRILNLPRGNFYFKSDFEENLEEFAKLDGPARETLATHLRKLFSKPPPLERVVVVVQQQGSGDSELLLLLAKIILIPLTLLYVLMLMFNTKILVILITFALLYYMLYETILEWINRSDDRPGTVVLCVNGKKVRVNKYHLASKSDYFERFFFGEGYKKNAKLDIDPPANVAHFKRMLDTMDPKNRPLDDDCLEGLYHLANQYFMRELEEKCRNFLAISKHSAIFKYRLADKYGYDWFKNEFSNTSEREILECDDFVENLEEFAKLDVQARKALKIEIDQIFLTPAYVKR